jgi:ABC-type multidrug transport system ATPase subunit
MPDAIEIHELYKNYAGEKALQGVSFQVGPGKLYGMIGADGAGKTTVMRILTTLINADTGTARVLGREVRRDFRSLRSEIGYMPQKFSLYPDLTVSENLRFFADIFNVTGAEKRDRIKRLLEFSRLGPFLDRRAGNLSGGMKQKLALACTLIHKPRVLFLDEPTTGVDPVSRHEFWTILHELNQEGVTILISTPYMSEAALCQELVFMHQGRAVLQGTPAELLHGFPLALYEVSGNNAALSVPPGLGFPPGVKQLYSVGGHLHLAAEPSLSSRETLLPWLRSQVPEAQVLIRIEPDMEDLFFHMLTK